MNATAAVNGYERFVDALLEGRLALGQTLRQEELCDVLGLSLSPLRELTALLEADGLISVRRRIGLTILYPDVKFVGNTFQFRGLLERAGIARFADLVTAGWIRDMRNRHAEVLDFVRQVHDPARFRRAVIEIEVLFHHSFMAAFDNAQIMQTYQRLFLRANLLRLVNAEAVGTLRTIQALTEHLEIIDALEQRDAENAVAILDRHLQGSLYRTLNT